MRLKCLRECFSPLECCSKDVFTELYEAVLTLPREVIEMIVAYLSVGNLSMVTL